MMTINQEQQQLPSSITAEIIKRWSGDNGGGNSNHCQQPSVIRVTSGSTLKNLLQIMTPPNECDANNASSSGNNDNGATMAASTAATDHDHHQQQQQVERVVIEKLGINTYACSKWDDKDRNALVEFIRSNNNNNGTTTTMGIINQIEILLSNGNVKDSPAPTRSFMFALSIIHAASTSTTATAAVTHNDDNHHNEEGEEDGQHQKRQQRQRPCSIKIILDLYSLNFLDATHFISYIAKSCTEFHVMNLFQQKPTQQIVNTFLKALQTMMKEQQQQQPATATTTPTPPPIRIQMFDPTKPIIIQNLDLPAIKLLSQSISFFVETNDNQQPEQQSSPPPPSPLKTIKLHIKKLHAGGLKGLAEFLQDDNCPIQTLFLDIDGKIPKCVDSNKFHTVLRNKKLLCINPDDDHHVATTTNGTHHPFTAVFLQAGKDGCQLVVSPEVLTRKSKYFEVLFSGRFGVERQTEENAANYIVHLPNCCDGIALQALVTFLRYGKERRLDIPDSTFCNNQVRFQAMATLAHLAQYLLISDLIPKVYKLLSDTLRKFPDAAFVALKVFRYYNKCNYCNNNSSSNSQANSSNNNSQANNSNNHHHSCKSIPLVFELLALKHIQYAEIHLLDAFMKKHESNRSIQKLCQGYDADDDDNTRQPTTITFVGQDSKKVKSRYNCNTTTTKVGGSSSGSSSSGGLKNFLERVEKATTEGYLDPTIDLVTLPCRTGQITSNLINEIVGSKNNNNKKKEKEETAAPAAQGRLLAAAAVSGTTKQQHQVLLLLILVACCFAAMLVGIAVLLGTHNNNKEILLSYLCTPCPEPILTCTCIGALKNWFLHYLPPPLVSTIVPTS